MSRKDRNFVILLIYVDGILMTGDSTSKINQLKDVLNKEFEMSYLSGLEKLLGIEIKRY